MADMTDSPAAASRHAALPSLASFREMSTRRVAAEPVDTADVARVAAELLTDARQLRGRHGEAIVVAPAGSPEHELHVNIHACERAALTAQRRGVEALTARLRNDRALLASIAESAFVDLESSARSLLAASSLSDQLLVADLISNGAPPPPPVGFDAAELVVDLTGDSVDVGFRPMELDVADELDEMAESFAPTDWEARRAAILDRVEQVRRSAPDPTTQQEKERLSPIVAAALAPTPPEPRPSAEPLSDVPDAATDPVSHLAAAGSAAEDPSDPVEPTRALESAPAPAVDHEETSDAIVIDIADAPSARADDTDETADPLAEVIELQPDVVAPEWPVWQGPSRSIRSDVVHPLRPGVAEAALRAVEAAEKSNDSEDREGDTPRLVSVAPDIPDPPPVVEPSEDQAEDAIAKFSFAPEAPAAEPSTEPPDNTPSRKTQEEIAEEARALIAGQVTDTATADAFSRREVRRRQRRLRRHQRAVEKVENRTQRDRRKAEFEHVRALAEDGSAVDQTAPTGMAQFLVALLVCILVVMIAVGVWFIFADDPGLF